MDDAGAVDERRRGRDGEVERIGLDEHAQPLRNEPAPAEHLVLVGIPPRPRVARAAEGQQARRGEGGDDHVRGRPLAVQVDREVGGRTGPVQRLELAGRQHLVDRADQVGDRCQRGRRRQHEPVPGHRRPHRPDRRDAGQQVTEPQWPQHHGGRRGGYGHKRPQVRERSTRALVEWPSR